MLENPGIPLPFRIQTISLKVLDLKLKVLDIIKFYKKIFSPRTTAQYKQQLKQEGLEFIEYLKPKPSQTGFN
ncbi:hypothetical protein DER44DRAFT_126791 [Fusarium oxysporum]|nr:hypothetical protein DER44DRAFT_181258 [Fusarium oxysporum]KAH7187785.1 hypothetical protein DER44DRAFT_126791 [Fusarium oxysporum]